MKLDLIQDTWFLNKDIVDFVLSVPSERLSTIHNFKDNFELMIQRLIDRNYIMVFHEGSTITGICCWCLVNRENQGDINKIRWILPKDLTNGNILYIPVCVLTSSARSLDIKRKFEELGYRKKIKEVLWLTDKWYRRQIANENRELWASSARQISTN